MTGQREDKTMNKTVTIDWKLNDMFDTLRGKSKAEQEKLVYQWVKSGHACLSQFRELVDHLSKIS
jgi:hypothetical protein